MHSEIAAEQLVRLNIGGHKYETTLETLSRRGPNALSRLVSLRRDPNLFHFFDRDGQYFAVLLEYLRTGSVIIPPHMSVSSVHREAGFFEISLPPTAIHMPPPPQLRYDGIYLARIMKIVPGFFMFGPDNRFFHQTTNPLHNYVRQYTVSHCVVQWSLGGLANEEQHAFISHTGDVIADTGHSFIPFVEPLPGSCFRILSNRVGDGMSFDIIDSLGDDHYRRIKFVADGKAMPIGEITFLPGKQLTFKALVSRSAVFESLPVQLEETNVAGNLVYSFTSENFETGVGFMGTKVTKRYQIEIMCLGEFCLVRSLTMDCSKGVKGTKWSPAADTHFQEVFLVFPRARPKAIEAY